MAAQAKLNEPNTLTVLEAKFKERLDGLDQTVKAHQHLNEQHQVYLKAWAGAMPGEEYMLFTCFKYLEDELGKVAAGPRTDPAMFIFRKLLGEKERMMQEIEINIKKDHDDKLSIISTVMAMHHNQTEERVKDVEGEIVFVKIAITCILPASNQAPPRQLRRLFVPGLYMRPMLASCGRPHWRCQHGWSRPAQRLLDGGRRPTAGTSSQEGRGRDSA